MNWYNLRFYWQMTGNLIGLKNRKNVMVRSNVPSKTYKMERATVLNEP